MTRVETIVVGGGIGAVQPFVAPVVDAGAVSGPYIVVGSSVNVQHANTIVVGMGNVTSQSNEMQLGGPGLPVQLFRFGRGTVHTATHNVDFRCTNAQGTNVFAGALTIYPPVSTGNATTGDITLVSTVPGASGATPQTTRGGFRVKGSTTADDTDIMVFDVSAGSVKRVSRGAVDSGGVGFRVLRIPN
jgi:hypothetical protein